MYALPDSMIQASPPQINPASSTKQTGKYRSVLQSSETVSVNVEPPKNCHIPLIKNAWRQYLGQNIATTELPSLFDGNSLDGLSARSAFILFNRIEMTLNNTKNEEKQLDLYQALTAMQKKCERHLKIRACLSPCSKTLEQKIDALLVKYKHLSEKIKSQDPSSKNDDLKKKPKQKALTDFSLVPFGNLEASHDKKALLNEMFDGADNSNLKHKESYKEAVSCFLVFINSEERDIGRLMDSLIALVEKSLIMFNSNVTIGDGGVSSNLLISKYFHLLTDTLRQIEMRSRIKEPIKQLLLMFSKNGRDAEKIDLLFILNVFHLFLKNLNDVKTKTSYTIL